jgi:Na+-translocating ferredoxin:NAD+ oxidoreductase subunit D
MALLHITSPHTHKATNTHDVMKWVLIATLPGIVALTFFFGWGTLINLLLASLTAIGCEALILKIRQRSVGFYLNDYSALVTAVLLGLSLPPYAPWWVVVVGTSFAIIIAKHLYGGLGFNPFNPAMIGYVLLLISFPQAMTQWPLPEPLLADKTLLTISQSLSTVFLAAPVDGYTGATPLDLFKYQDGLLVEQIYTQQPLFSEAHLAGVGWEWINIGFLCGGLLLIYKRIISWHAPISMLLALSLLACIFYNGGSSESGGSPLLHLLSGGTMLGAFFIVTDPVTGATSDKGKLIFGASVGIITYTIRVWGNYPDAVAFSVLLMNFAAPFIDYYTTPRTYGHQAPDFITRQQ